MLRYVAWISDPSDEASAHESRELARSFEGQQLWSRAFAHPGIEIHVTGCLPRSNEVYTMGNSGVILGKLFTGNEGISRNVPTTIPHEDARTIAATGGRNLVSCYWGRYVAFLCDPDQRTVRILRAPCGSLPCLGIRLGRLELYCSWMEDLALAGLNRWSINWAVVCALLCGAPPDIRHTGLQGLSQLLGGECVTHANGRSERTFYWDPIRASEVSCDIEGAARLLHSRVVDCVRAWRGCYERVHQTLSGGLDSSIVAASQDRAALESTTFFNYYLAESDSDERKFARLVASHLGVELIEWEHNPFLSLQGLLRMHRLPLPPLCLHSLEFSEREAKFCAQKGATAIFGGHGGDQAFYTAAATPCASSYLSRHGLRPRAWGVLLDAAYRDRRSVWHVLREIREHRNQPLQFLFGMQLGKYRSLTLLEPDIIEHIRRAQPVWIHPLLRDPTGLDPARLVHAEQVLPSDDYYDHFCGPDYPERISPILSQPVVELCLRLPRQLLIRGGWTRAVARRAFQNDLPYAIVTRREKGSVRDHFRSILRCNRDFARELLLEGELARQNIINRKKTETALAGDPTRAQTDTIELAILLCAIGWLRQF
jgi:asparagine synthase (glutamine-hydrolysing)